MKVSIGYKLRSGPWGGGNQAMRALADDLRRRGVQVAFDLNECDLDIILMTDPRRRSLTASYNDEDVFRYLRRVNHGAIVVHRANECDERKGTRGVNRQLLAANRCADHTVFVSSWLKHHFVRLGLPCTSRSVILNGAARSIFYSEGYQAWDGNGPLKLVTHHWGAHWMKGFDIYERVDGLIAADEFRGRLTFTYIGNLPQGFRFTNATYIEPAHGRALADQLRRHHVYLTASRNEPGSNHQNEGAACGLPLLYRQSGCLPEYCSGFGIGFTEKNFEEKLSEMFKTYDRWAPRMSEYPHTAERMCERYYDLFERLIRRRDAIIARRSKFRRLGWSFRRLLT